MSCAVDKSGGQEARQKQVRKVTNMLMDGLGKVTSMLMGCGTRQTGRQELVQNGG